MKPSDLRTGNWVNTKRFHIPEHIGDYQFKHQWFEWVDRFDPIPLTDEWLEKFGFDNRQIVAGSCMMKVETHNLNKGFAWYFDSFKFVALEYVHQLQNLYHALPGKN